MSDRHRARAACARLLPRVIACAVLFLPVAHAGRARAQGEPVRLDGVAAVVGGSTPGANVEVVLRSDVELRARLSLLAGLRDASEIGPLPSSLLRATLGELVGEQLIAREARRVQAVTPSAADVERERARLVRTAGGRARVDGLLRSLSASADELLAIAQRRALVAGFLSANLEGVNEVTDSALERALEADPSLLEGRTRAQARAVLRARLSREALDHTVARWVAVLRARTEVHVYADY